MTELNQSVELISDKNALLEKVRKNGLYLRFGSEELRNDQVVVIEAINKNGESFQYACEELKNEKEFVLKAVRTRGETLQFACEELRNDKEVVLKAAKQNYISFKFASSELRKSKDFLLEIVKKDGCTIRFAHPELRKDKEILLEAVKNRGDSLEYASEELKNDKMIVIEALKQDGLALKYASEELRNDKQVVLFAVEQSEEALAYASLNLKNDKDVVMIACRGGRNAFKHIGDILTRESILLNEVKKLEGDIEAAFDNTQNNSREKDEWEDFLIDILKKTNKKEYRFAPPSFGSDEKEIIQKLFEEIKEKQFSDFDIYKFLGRGAFAATYLCRVFGCSPLVVMKIYNNPRMSKKKRKEVVLRDSLYIPYHPNVVTILNHSEKEKIDFHKFPDYESFWREVVGDVRSRYGGMIVMKFHRLNLCSYFNNVMFFGQKDIIFMMSGIINGVCHLHENMIVHRDLHPGNIFVDPEYGKIVIGDFGCCLDLRSNSTGFKVHKDHEMMFSFTNDSCFKKDGIGFKVGGYLKLIPPEILNYNSLKEEFLDYEKCDLYSVGVLGKMICQKCYFNDRKFKEMVEIEKILEEICSTELEKRGTYLGVKEFFDELLRLELKKEEEE